MQHKQAASSTQATSNLGTAGAGQQAAPQDFARGVSGTLPVSSALAPPTATGTAPGTATGSSAAVAGGPGGQGLRSGLNAFNAAAGSAGGGAAYVQPGRLHVPAAAADQDQGVQPTRLSAGLKRRHACLLGLLKRVIRECSTQFHSIALSKRMAERALLCMWHFSSGGTRASMLADVMIGGHA